MASHKRAPIHGPSRRDSLQLGLTALLGGALIWLFRNRKWL